MGHFTRLMLLMVVVVVVMMGPMKSASAFTATRHGSKSNLVRRSAAPSGIDEWPQLAQASVFFAAYAGLGVGTIAGTKVLDAVSQVIGLERWRTNVIDSPLLPSILGALYLTAGLGHFLNADSFRDIYPPPGTWGIWYLPGSAAFHVAWTGLVEALGGVGLLFGAFNASNENNEGGEENDNDLIRNLIQPTSALVLFLLTVLVTPANIYMFTHGATMEPDMGPLGVQFHGIRFCVQVLLLSLLLTLSKDSFFFAWGDELD